MHFRFDLLFEHDFSAFENLVNMRTQLARFRIDDGELLFDSKSERVVLHANDDGQEMFLKNNALSSREQPSDPVAKLNGQITGFLDSAQNTARRVRPTNVAL